MAALATLATSQFLEAKVKLRKSFSFILFYGSRFFKSENE